MKKIFCTIFLLVILISASFGQKPASFDYYEYWKRASRKIIKMKDEEALKIIDTIYYQAKKEHQPDQYLKAIFCQIKYAKKYKYIENIQNKIDKIDYEIKNASEPEVQILYSYKAETLWSFYNYNRSQFLGRTTTINYKKEDLLTWDFRALVEEVFKCYQLSLKNDKLLKSTKLTEYDQVLFKHDSNRVYRPTLYDLLVHRAIDYYMDDEPQIVKPAITFYVNNPLYMSNVKDFASINITTPDSLSMKFYALQLLQQAIQFHLNDSDATALIDVDLKRIEFVNKNATYLNKENLYLESLKNLHNKYIDSPMSSAICYEIAKFYKKKASDYDSLNNPKPQNYYLEALKYADYAIDKFPNTIGANNCRFVKERILNLKKITVQLEKYSLPDVPSKMMVHLQNVKELHTRIIAISNDHFDTLSLNNYGDKLIQKLSKLKYLSQSKVTFSFPEDYQERSVEIALQPLPIGSYIILFSNDENFNYLESAISYDWITITNLAFAERYVEDGSIELGVFDRKVGTPVTGASVVVKVDRYNSDEKIIRSAGITNTDGHCKIPNLKEYDRFKSYIIKTKNDQVEISENVYFLRDYKDEIEYETTNTYFFTDRAIYRPGQTIYFKGIVVKTKGSSSKPASGKKTKIKLYNKDQTISSIELVTNEFGSFSGSFIAPISGITGELYIQEENNDDNKYYYRNDDAKCIRVEEYKRPKFEATFNPIKGSYRLNDTITVTGIVKAFAGNAIDGAKVKYRVTREKHSEWGYWNNSRNYYNSEINNGDAFTNNKGEYTIKFNAIPEESSNNNLFAIYYYTVTADITDINGETHTASTSIPISSTAINIYFSIPEDVDQSDKANKFRILTTNSNNQLEAASLSVKVTRLEHPPKIYNSRYWDRPSSYIYSKEEFSKLFPNDEYSNENDRSKWKREEIACQYTINTKVDSLLQFNELEKWANGTYLIEVEGKDNIGSEIKKSQFFSVFNSKNAKSTKYTHLSIRSKLDTVNSKKTLQISLESSHPNATVFLEVLCESNLLYKKWIKLDGNVKTIKLPLYNLDGIITSKAILSFNNRDYISGSRVVIPKKNQRLDVKFATFRNKLNPGEEEMWQLTIKGCDGEKVASELLATMYDASLDTFIPNNWEFYLPWRFKRWKYYWVTNSYNFGKDPESLYFKHNPSNLNEESIQYEYLNMKYYDLEYETVVHYIRPIFCKDGGSCSSIGFRPDDGSSSPSADKGMDKVSVGIDTTGNQKEGLSPIQIRKNFNETAFFMPQLATDKDGNVVIKFKVPESLTRWKIMGLAHTKDLRIGQFTKELVTQKELMVVPNQPRFFRESDQMEFNAKISNISDKDLNGIAKIEFFDALTMKPINSELGLTTLEIPFSTLKGQSTSVAWKIAIPQGLMAITYRVTAQAGNFSDGEEMTLPVLTNRMLVTESLPLPINGNQTKTFSFDKLKSDTSTTLKNFKYTLEFTSNPAWYAIQSLPYLMEYPYECSEQTFNRFYANSIATHIANSIPKIKAVFESWKINSPEALMSNLEKNQELKSIMIEETPWVLDAKSETEQKKRIGLLFDIINMSTQQDATLKKLLEKQLESGGWSWFPDMDEDPYISLYIISGFGHLKTLEAFDFESNPITVDALNNAINHIDYLMDQEYRTLKKSNDKFNKEDHLSNFIIQYLYARSFFINEEEEVADKKEAFNFYSNQSEKYWLNKSLFLQGMIAMAHFRNGNEEIAKKIMASIKDRAMFSEEMGMYWRNEGGGYYWYEAPIERQALLIEAFDLITNDQESVEKMKIWLLKQKQTQNWGTTKSTAEACYALLLKGTSQLTDDQLVEIKIGDKVIDPKKMDNVKVEAGTGYFKTAWNGTEITPNMGNITVTKSSAGVAWGSVYWQYFENLDKITPAATPLSMKKELFIVRATPTGEVIEPVKAGDKIKVGDKIRVRIVLRSDRDMEYVHMKDMRAAAFEPINVLSQYKYQDGLGYYESTRDAATNFFFDYLRKGTYVFEYTLFATQKGDFSNGITTIQCMYAPEFTSHSEGVRVVVE